MSNALPSSVSFEKMILRDYGVFLGINEIIFDRHRTVIVGGGGTGKTTIFNALACLGPARGIKANELKDGSEMPVKVVTSGNRRLVTDYRNIIFPSCESLLLFANSFYERASKTIEGETRTIFQSILSHKPHKIKIRDDLGPKHMAFGERICLGYALAFAIRKMRNLDLPVVLDSPYGYLDTEQRTGFSEFLKNQSCQQILLGCEAQFMGIGEIKPNYRLDYVSGTRITKL